MLTRREFLGTTAAVATLPAATGLAPVEPEIAGIRYWRDLAGTIPAKAGDPIARVDGLIDQSGSLTQPDPSKRPSRGAFPF